MTMIRNSRTVDTILEGISDEWSGEEICNVTKAHSSLRVVWLRTIIFFNLFQTRCYKKTLFFNSFSAELLILKKNVRSAVTQPEWERTQSEEGDKLGSDLGRANMIKLVLQRHANRILRQNNQELTVLPGPFDSDLGEGDSRNCRTVFYRGFFGSFE